MIDEGRGNYGCISIYQEIEGFAVVKLEAIVKKFKFFFENGISNINRIAVVTNKAWIQKIIDLEYKLFKKIDMKGFAIDHNLKP